MHVMVRCPSTFGHIHSAWLPLSVVDSISKAWCVHNGEFEFHAFLLDANGTFGDFHCFVDPFCTQGKQRGKYTVFLNSNSAAPLF